MFSVPSVLGTVQNRMSSAFPTCIMAQTSFTSFFYLVAYFF